MPWHLVAAASRSCPLSRCGTSAAEMVADLASLLTGLVVARTSRPVRGLWEMLSWLQPAGHAVHRTQGLRPCLLTGSCLSCLRPISTI